MLVCNTKVILKGLQTQLQEEKEPANSMGGQQEDRRQGERKTGEEIQEKELEYM